MGTKRWLGIVASICMLLGGKCKGPIERRIVHTTGILTAPPGHRVLALYSSLHWIFASRSGGTKSTPTTTTMPPRIRFCSSCTALPLRPRPAHHFAKLEWHTSSRTVSRPYSDKSKDLPVSEDGKGPNTDPLPHISEEAAAIAKATGSDGPDLTQGTPVSEV